jgi:hypothetical protein
MRTLKLVGALSVAGAILLASYAPAQAAPSHLFPQLRNQTPKTGAPSKCDGAAGTAAGAMAGTGMAVGALAAGALIGAGDCAFTPRLWS